MSAALFLLRTQRRGPHDPGKGRPAHRRFSIGVFCAVISSVAIWTGGALAQTTATPTASPAAITVGTSTPIFMTVFLPDPTIIPQSVVVQQLNPTGTVVLGPLVDNGTNGDLIAGDHIYSGAVVVNPPALGTVTLRVSYGRLGALLRQASNPITLDVTSPGVPTTPVPPDFSQIDTDPVTGVEIVSNVVLTCFANTATIPQIQTVAALVGGQLIGRFSELGQCYQIQLPTSSGAAVESAIATLSAQPLVVSAEADALGALDGKTCMGLPTCGSVSFTNVGLNRAQTVNSGSGQTVAVLDSGIDLSNAILAAQVIPGIDETGGKSTQDKIFHGTAVSSIVAATAPSVLIMPIKVADLIKGQVRLSASTSTRGINDAVSAGVPIINMSYTGGGPKLALETLAIQRAELSGSGVVPVAAAGNVGDTTIRYPAGHLGVIAVGNVDSQDVRWGPDSTLWTTLMMQGPSSHGDSWVNIAAPGVNIPILVLGGMMSTGIGTSFSAPFVAGTAALVRSRFQSLTGSQVRNQILKSATPLAPDTMGNLNQDLGSGRLDAYAALGAIVMTHTGNTSSVDFNVSGSWGDSGGFTLGFQATSCELRLVNPCSADFPITLSKLSKGSYTLTFHDTDPTNDISLNLALAVPGLTFTSVVRGNGTINSSDNQRATAFLIGTAINASLSFVTFNVVKQ
jgi:Subtilase family